MRLSCGRLAFPLSQVFQISAREEFLRCEGWALRGEGGFFAAGSVQRSATASI